MPYKEREKSGEARKRKKPDYRVTNWSEYNLSLKKRGMISLYFPGGDLKAQFINDKPYVNGMSGQEPTYREAYIELIYTFYRLHGWGMRQIKGYLEGTVKLMNRRNKSGSRETNSARGWQEEEGYWKQSTWVTSLQSRNA